MIPPLALALAYLLGAVPFGFLLVRWKSGRDVRALGSGNIGASNVLRTSGRSAGIVVLLLDISKGYAAVWIMDRVSNGSILWNSLAALAVIAGHAFPVFLKFHGGKAVASFIGAFFYLTPVPLLAVVFVFIVVITATHYISLGSVIAAGSFPFAVWLILHPPAPLVLSALVAGVFIVWRHRANIARIRAGNENIFSFGGRA